MCERILAVSRVSAFRANATEFSHCTAQCKENTILLKLKQIVEIVNGTKIFLCVCCYCHSVKELRKKRGIWSGRAGEKPLTHTHTRRAAYMLYSWWYVAQIQQPHKSYIRAYYTSIRFTVYSRYDFRFSCYLCIVVFSCSVGVFSQRTLYTHQHWVQLYWNESFYLCMSILFPFSRFVGFFPIADRRSKYRHVYRSIYAENANL